ncbi:MAG: YhcH/YjgK/YiaL family protein [Gemmiger sp.]|nr:YhcH/YjgK/YiaL family protein [Gemmiger sp.]
MISGNIYEKSDLSLLPAPLRRAVELLRTTDFANHEPGRFVLEEDRLILQVLDLTTAPRATLRPEVHKKYIDVQFLAAGGPEKIAWYPDLGQAVVDENLLDTPRDICFYHNDPTQREGMIEMQPGSYAMFFPWDVHVPAIQAESPAAIRKIVLKVALEGCL